MTSTRHYLIQAAANAIREGQPEAAEIIMSNLPEPEPVGPEQLPATITFSTQEKADDALRVLLDHGCTAIR